MKPLYVAGAALLGGLMAVGTASALTVTETNNVAVLNGALLAPGSGINVNTSGLLSGSVQQQGTFTGFTLAPSSGATPTLTLGDGVVLTSGKAATPLTNTVNQYNPIFPGSGSYAPLSALAGTGTNDANVLSYAFTLDAGLNALQMQFVFGTDEFPTQSVTDIFGFFVDGVNFAEFPGGELISNTPGNPTNFILNPVGSGLYGIEYNGLTNVFTVTGLLDGSLAEHTLNIAIADTSDSIFDSGVYLAGLKGVSSAGGGGIGDPGTPVPEPATLAILGMGLLGLAAIRRSQQV
jgi:hypothetical protein